MEASSLDNELSEYWSLLLTDQKQVVLKLVDSFLQADETHEQLQEPVSAYSADTYNFPKELLQKLSLSQKTALLELIQSLSGGDQRISIEEYNRELDEAEAEYQRGEFVTHEEVLSMVKKWVNGE